MSKWNKVETVSAGGQKLPFMLPGKFKVRIDKCKDFEGHQGDLFFINEFEILESSNADIPVGKFYSQVIKYNQNMGPVNVKRFILAANGLDPNDPDNDDAVGAEEVELVLSEDQPLSGLVMNLQCDTITTREGNPFTVHVWEPIETDEEDEE